MPRCIKRVDNPNPSKYEELTSGQISRTAVWGRPLKSLRILFFAVPGKCKESRFLSEFHNDIGAYTA